MKILLVSYLFPPAGGIAVQRALSLARYLPENGCEVHVLSAASAPAPVLDPNLLSLIPPSVSLHHAWTPSVPFALGQKLSGLAARTGKKSKTALDVSPQAAKGNSRLRMLKRILYPDPEVLWRPFSYRAAANIIKKHHIDTLLVTAPPFSCLLTGVALKRRFPEIFLISDFRDGWIDWYVNAFEFFKGDEAERRSKLSERAVIEASDLVVSVTSALQQKLIRRYCDQPVEKFPLVQNGYDPALLKSAQACSPQDASKIKVTYAGTLYKQTSARYYLDALDEMPENIRNCFETHFLGRVAHEEIETQKDRLSRVVIHGFVPQAQAFECLVNSDILLVNMTDPQCHTGKAFEYLGMRKPILAFTPPDGELAQLLRTVGGAWIVDPTDRAAARHTLNEIYQQCRSGEKLRAPDSEAVRQFERPRLTAKYVEIIRAARNVQMQSLDYGSATPSDAGAGSRV